jgi:hypothetical protein
MEPISLILAALLAGAAKAAGDAIPDAYKGLKTLIKRKFEIQGKSDLATILNKFEEKPEKTKPLLKDELIEVGADKDEEIIKAAQELLKQIKPEESASGKYKINVAGDIKGIVGDITGGNIDQTIS